MRPKDEIGNLHERVQRVDKLYPKISAEGPGVGRLEGNSFPRVSACWGIGVEYGSLAGRSFHQDLRSVLGICYGPLGNVDGTLLAMIAGYEGCLHSQGPDHPSKGESFDEG